jgi:hypothetical protein
MSGVREGDFGHMHALGYRNSSTGLEYNGTDFCKDAMKQYLNELGPYLKENLPFVRDSIEEAEIAKMGGTKRCPAFDVPVPVGNTANISVNLGNPSHFDCNDASLCHALWLSQTGRSVKNWYFVVPHASIDGSNGVVVELFHGAHLSWHGDELKHCSAVPEEEEGNAVFGVFAGSCSEPYPRRS